MDDLLHLAPHSGATTNNAHSDCRIDLKFEQLELRIAEQERSNLEQKQTIQDLQNDMKSLKSIQSEHRTESQKSFEYQNTKKKKLYALLNDVHSSVKNMTTKKELQLLSKQIDVLKAHVDHVFAGLHASTSTPAQDLITFSQGHALVDLQEVTETPRGSFVDIDKGVKPSSRIATSIERSSSTARGLSPIVHVSPPSLTDRSPHVTEQPTNLVKKVRFDLESAQTGTPTNAPASDSRSEDPLAPNATLRKSMLKRARDVTVEASPFISHKDGPKRQRASRFLDMFKGGGLDGESDDEDYTSIVQTELCEDTAARDARRGTQRVDADVPSRSRAVKSLDSMERDDTEANLEVAEQAVASLRDALKADPLEPTTIETRRSSRVPKPKNFGDVEVHGWKNKNRGRSM